MAPAVTASTDRRRTNSVWGGQTEMTDRVGQLSEKRFVALWNTSASLSEVTEKVKGEVGTPCPRWAVLARAVALREQGLDLKPMPKAA